MAQLVDHHPEAGSQAHPDLNADLSHYDQEKVESSLQPDSQHQEPYDRAEQLKPGYEIIAPGCLQHARDQHRVAITRARERLQPQQLDDQLVRFSFECRGWQRSVSHRQDARAT